MKTTKIITFSLFFILVFFYSCGKKDNTTSQYPYEAEVIGNNTDCGLYEIKITQGLKSVENIVGTSPVEGVYIAKNLPQSLEKQGLTILLDIRKPTSSELGVCSHTGPSYTWLYVIKAEKK